MRTRTSYHTREKTLSRKVTSEVQRHPSSKTANHCALLGVVGSPNFFEAVSKFRNKLHFRDARDSKSIAQHWTTLRIGLTHCDGLSLSKSTLPPIQTLSALPSCQKNICRSQKKLKMIPRQHISSKAKCCKAIHAEAIHID